MEVSLAVCAKECKPQVQLSMQPGKNIVLCLEERVYNVSDLALLDTDCDGLEVDDDVHSSISDTYNCTILNSTEHESVNDGNKVHVCEQVMVIKCVRTVPSINVNRGDDMSDYSDDDSDGGAGGRSIDDGADDDLVLGLSLNKADSDEPPCNVFINVSMKELGRLRCYLYCYAQFLLILCTCMNHWHYQLPHARCTCELYL